MYHIIVISVAYAAHEVRLPYATLTYILTYLDALQSRSTCFKIVTQFYVHTPVTLIKNLLSSWLKKYLCFINFSIILSFVLLLQTNKNFLHE